MIYINTKRQLAYLIISIKTIWNTEIKKGKRQKESVFTIKVKFMIYNCTTVGTMSVQVIDKGWWSLYQLDGVTLNTKKFSMLQPKKTILT